MNWYNLASSNDVEFFFVNSGNNFDDTYEENNFYEQAWEIAQKSSINILRDKDLDTVAVINGKVIGSLWNSWDSNGGYSMDIVVSPNFQRIGIGSKLIDIGIESFNNDSDAYGDEAHFDLDVVNIEVVKMLKNRGFIVDQEENGHYLMKKSTSEAI